MNSSIRYFRNWLHNHKFYWLAKKIDIMLDADRQIKRSEYEKGIVIFDSREAEKRERFVQTYIILYGLLLSYGQGTLLQNTAMAFFLLFLFCIIMYYSILNSHFGTRIIIGTYGVKGIVYIINFIAILSTFILSYILIIFFQIIGNGSSSVYLNKYVFATAIFVVCIFLCLPLLINRSMFK